VSVLFSLNTKAHAFICACNFQKAIKILSSAVIGVAGDIRSPVSNVESISVGVVVIAEYGTVAKSPVTVSRIKILSSGTSDDFIGRAVAIVWQVVIF
jgi:hypothetical protein